MNILSTDNQIEKVFSHVRETILRTFSKSGVFMIGRVDMNEVKNSKLYFVIEPLPTTGINTIRCEVYTFLHVKDDHLDTDSLSDLMAKLGTAFSGVHDIGFSLSSFRLLGDTIDEFSRVQFSLSVKTIIINS